uniref:Candidate secreted effector n=1 Tax=Meloidogyne incognita TaxID=6306 RepID=A0A914KN74_MELIC
MFCVDLLLFSLFLHHCYKYTQTTIIKLKHDLIFHLLIKYFNVIIINFRIFLTALIIVLIFF